MCNYAQILLKLYSAHACKTAPAHSCKIVQIFAQLQHQGYALNLKNNMKRYVGRKTVKYKV